MFNEFVAEGIDPWGASNRVIDELPNYLVGNTPRTKFVLDRLIELINNLPESFEKKEPLADLQSQREKLT